MLVKVFGNVKEVSPQRVNASLSIRFKASGNATEVRAQQLENVFVSILVIFRGSAREARLMQFENVERPI